MTRNMRKWRLKFGNENISGRAMPLVLQFRDHLLTQIENPNEALQFQHSLSSVSSSWTSVSLFVSFIVIGFSKVPIRVYFCIISFIRILSLSTILCFSVLLWPFFLSLYVCMLDEIYQFRSKLGQFIQNFDRNEFGIHCIWHIIVCLM